MPISKLLRSWPLAISCGLAWACGPKPLQDDPNAHVPLATAPEWHNWSGDLVYRPISDGESYYFSPTSRAELQEILSNRPAGMKMRVSGQRHSQPPLVLADNRDETPEAAKTWVIDLSCYSDLGPDGKESFVLDATNGTLTVNAGVREDLIDAILTEHDLMLPTVTAGGFFSAGGMTAVDVHGATVASPIFAETASSYTIMTADGSVTTIDESSERAEGWSPLQFARVSLGALGIVTSVTFDVLPRPYATTVDSGRDKLRLHTEDEFVAAYRQLLAAHDRLETFYNPYTSEFLVLWWDVVESPKRRKRNKAREVAGACTIAQADLFGAPFEGHVVEKDAEAIEHRVQFHGTDEDAKLLVDGAIDVVEKQVRAANRRHSDLWLAKATQGIFMSYFLELPAADDAGLRKVWQGLQVVATADRTDFRLTGPLEFRFIRGGDSVMAGTYSGTSDALFVNYDLIAFAETTAAPTYPPALLEFFGGIERRWAAMDAWPHNGKMYGFHDPAAPEGDATEPFDPAYLNALTDRRRERVEAFERYRRARDPEGVFCNAYLENLGLCGAEAASSSPEEAEAEPEAAEAEEGEGEGEAEDEDEAGEDEAGEDEDEAGEDEDEDEDEDEGEDEEEDEEDEEDEGG